MGARPMARVIQEHIKKGLADEVLFGKLKGGGHVRVVVVKDDNSRDKLGFEYSRARSRRSRRRSRRRRSPSARACASRSRRAAMAGPRVAARCRRCRWSGLIVRTSSKAGPRARPSLCAHVACVAQLAPAVALCDEQACRCRRNPSPLVASGGFLLGVRTAFTSVFGFVIAFTYIGFGALCHDYGLSMGWAMFSTALQWAGPAQVILVTGMGPGTALFETAVAVSLSSVRLFPIVVALIPVVRQENTRLWQLFVPVHFMAISVWIESMRAAPRLAARAAHPVLQRCRPDAAEHRRGVHRRRLHHPGPAAGVFAPALCS